ncbi:hypothetical protein [Pseudocnuella soli]|uniref:hypothetical protein n=1 Tax=Pseudocnuella soli TaxID=2502779 RepID=UPI001049509C|nr:hypothetical protein [Pseudocnuella soli]
MIALFKQKSPANLVMLLIFGLLIKMPYLLQPASLPGTLPGGLLFQGLLQVLAGGNPHSLTAALVAFALLYSQALMINYGVNEHRLTQKFTFLPGMAYLLTTSLVPEWNLLSPPLVASTLIIWAILKLFRTYNQQEVLGTLFNTGLIVGAASMVFFPSVAFLLCLLLGILILRPFRVNELLLFLMGALTPYYFYAVYLFLNDSLQLQTLFPPIHIDLPQVGQSIRLAVAAGFLTIPFMVGSWHIQAQLRKMLIQVRKYWTIVLFYLLLALLVPFINSNASLHNWVLALPAFAAFHACAYLYPTKKWVAPLMFWGTVAFVVAQQYGLLHFKGL